MILLVAIIAAIALTLRARKDSKYVEPGRPGPRQGARPRAHRQDGRVDAARPQPAAERAAAAAAETKA